MIDTEKNRIIPFTTLQDIEKQRKNNAITLFGAGRIAEKTVRLLRDVEIKSIVDNASNLWGENQESAS